MSITYDQVIEYVTEAVEEYKGVASYKKSLSLFLEELEEDVLASKVGMSEDEYANEAFDKSLDEELKNEAVFNFKTKQDGWLSDLSYHHKSYD